MSVKNKGCIIAITIFLVIVGYFIYSFFAYAMFLVDGDHFADNLEIPTGIQLDTPMNSNWDGVPDSITSLKKNRPDLLIYNSGQKGNYKYDFWYGNLERGTIYLKAFEITQELQLSSNSLREQTEELFFNTSDSVERTSSIHSFTIYEGDWGDYYAARFEVWFCSEWNGKERKLFEKNFKIQGWMH